MKWFFKWLDRKIYLSRDEVVATKHATTLHHPSNFSTIGMDFTVYRANGGTIIQTSMYDKKTDRSNTSLHIITDDKELGDEIAKIITYERLKN